MAEKSKLTPVMQQYVDFKAENPDALLMFRLGDFYESFFDDAKTISSRLGLVLTSRGTDGDGADIPMCGIPWHAADNYFGRLVRAGYKVALVEQMETPAQAKERGHKFIDRKITRVLTPGTLTDENLLTPKNSNFLVAIMATGRDSFDVAGCDISTGEFFIGHSGDIIDDMVRINPAEIIYPSMDAENETILHIRDAFKTTPVFEKIYKRGDIDTIVSCVFSGALQYGGEKINSAIGLLAGYLFNTQRGAALTFRAPYEFKSGKQLLIDSATWQSLEIDAPINDGGRCLVDVLDETKTAAGARKLRSYLRTLSGDVNEIKTRQEHIGHLLLNPDVRAMVTDMLSRTPDVGRSLARLLAGRGTPRDMRHIMDFLIILPNIRMLATRFDTTLAQKFSVINTNDELAIRLKSALADDLPTFFRDGGVIRDGFDLALDNMRNLSHGAKETIAAMQAQYATETGIGNLKIKFNNVLGYFIEVQSSKAEPLMRDDSGFIHRQTLSGNMRFTTARLIELDNDIRSASEKAAGIEDAIIESFIDDIRAISNDLLYAADTIADLDVWCALAVCAQNWNWVRPEITNDRCFDIVGGRHPVIESVLREHGNNFVSNDCNLNKTSVALLTGPNMAGKSTYLRQNALLVVMAHLGSYVPAARATIGVCDQLFSRVGASDNLAAGQSTFMVEMSETANILRRATPQSFIIFDEIGRGTATYDGMAIAQAVLEYLDKLSARTLFATHYHELTHLVGDTDGKLQNVSCLTIDVREHNNEIVFMHRIVVGVANRSYGIHVAKMAGMPENVVARAQVVLESLESEHTNDIPQCAQQQIKAPQKTSRPNGRVEAPGPQLSLFE